MLLSSWYLPLYINASNRHFFLDSERKEEEAELQKDIGILEDIEWISTTDKTKLNELERTEMNE